VDPFVNPLTIVVHDIGDITLEQGLHTVTNTSAPQVMHPSLSSLKVTRPSKSIEHYLDFDHAPIHQYLYMASKTLDA
jgi:hypothetical protein